MRDQAGRPRPPEEPGDGGEPEPRYDRFAATPALSRRAYVLWAVVPFVIAAAGFAIVAAVSQDDGGGGLGIRLPISGGAADTGSAGDQQLVGELQVDGQHCVYLRPRGGSGAAGTSDETQVWPVWPIGYTATLEGSHLTVDDRHGNQVAQSGQLVAMSGAYTSARDYATEPCLPQDGKVFVIDSPVTAVGG